MLDHLNWAEFLQRWSREAIDHAEEIGLEVTPQMRATGWIGAPPATAEAVAAAEHRLGRALPPSYRAFLTVSNGWPVTSFDYEAVRPVEDVGWMVDLDLETIEIWEDAAEEVAAEDEPEYLKNLRAQSVPDDSEDSDDIENEDEDGYLPDGPLLRRSLLLTTGSDLFLLDAGRADADGEWPSYDFTSWYPGQANHAPSFRAGMEKHYASFARFEADESVTHADVADRVETAYRALLAGEVDAGAVIEDARGYGDQRAEVLGLQLRTLAGQYRAEIGATSLRPAAGEPDPVLRQEIWPLLVAAVRNPHDALPWMLDHAYAGLPDEHAASVRELVATYDRDGGLTADFSATPVFAAAVERARTLLRSGRDDEAFAQIRAGLADWRPLSPLHLAPMGLLWDRELGPLMTTERRQQILATARATAHGTAGDDRG